MSERGPVHFSQLRHLAKSPAHYKAALDAPHVDTPAFRLGRLVHTLVLGGPEVVVWDGGQRRGKEWAEFQKTHDGLEIVTADEMETAQGMADSVLGCGDARDLLAGEHERIFNWSIGGRECAGRLDVLGPDFITELKTTTDAEPERFGRTATRLGYHAQLTWYLDGATAAGIGEPYRAYVIAIEKAPPYVVTPLELTPRALDMGRRTYRLWFERLLVCEASDAWPGYVQGIYPLDVPDDLNLIIDGEEIAS